MNLDHLQVIGRNAMEQAVIVDLEKSMGKLSANNATTQLEGAVGAGERVRVDAPFKLTRGRLDSGEWVLKIELLDPKLLAHFRAIVQRGANTYDMCEDMPTLRALVDGILDGGTSAPLSAPADEFEALIKKHQQVFSDYVVFQGLKEKVMPFREQKFHMMLGLSGELLELMQGFEIPEVERSKTNIIEELGDMLFFLVGLRRHYCHIGQRMPSIKAADSRLLQVEPNVSMQLINAVVNLIDMVKKDLISERLRPPADFHEAIEVVEWQMSKLCKTLGIQLYDLAESNMAKLNKRYKDKFTAQEAQQRADKAEAITSVNETAADFVARVGG